MKRNEIYISAGNPIRFYKSKDNQPDDYKSKYIQSDTTNIQLCSTGDLFTVTAELIDKNNKIIRTLPVKHTVLDGIYHFYTFSPSFVNLQGLYRVRARASMTDTEVTLWSSQICVCPDNADLTKLEWRNSYNKGSLNYAQIAMFAVRIEGGFLEKNYTPKVDETIYQNQAENFETLFSDDYYTRKFTVGRLPELPALGIPDTVHRIIHAAWSCDTVFVDGNRYGKFKDADWVPEEMEGYNNRTWTIEVIEQEDNTTTQFVVNPAVINTDATEKDISINIFSYKDAFIPYSLFSQLPSWITIPSDDGFGDVVLTIAESGDEDRTAQLVWQQTGSGKTAVLTVNQSGTMYLTGTVSGVDYSLLATVQGNEYNLIT